ncbi:glucosyltransferase domain-containing protein [Citrobacter freundii]|uniref:glucosyltransferase domain-containing protein n=1 Tax=Citrobacter freundii TaxID=546 RepID=UPI0031D184F4
MIKDWKFLILFSVMAYILQFIIADIYYGDDLFRVVDAYFLWGDDGRPLADIFYRIFLPLNSSYLPDVYPIPLLTSSILFSFVFYKVVENFCDEEGSFKYIIPIIFLSNTFFISNLLFRFDGAFMLLAMVLSSLPFALNRDNKWIWSVLTVISLVSSFCLYQSSVNIFIGFTSIYAYVAYCKTRDLKKSIISILHSAIIFVLSYAIYAFILKFIPLNAHFTEFNKAIDPSIEGVNIFINNISTSLIYVKKLLGSGLLYPITFAYIVSLAYVIHSSLKNRDVYILIFYFIAVITCAFSICGIVYFGKFASFFPRVFCGLSVFLVLPIIVLHKVRASNIIAIPVCLFLLIPQLVLCSTTLNASKFEISQADSISKSIIFDMQQYGSGEKIAIIGKPSHAPRTIPALRSFPIIEDLLPVVFRGGYDGGRYTLLANGMPRKQFASDKEIDFIRANIASLNPATSNNVYNYYVYNNISIIYFK